SRRGLGYGYDIPNGLRLKKELAHLSKWSRPRVQNQQVLYKTAEGQEQEKMAHPARFERATAGFGGHPGEKLLIGVSRRKTSSPRGY
uniref:hypothetical protein n=1 Tax=Glaciecola sp. SC05 TaxID=1987355 RepID=UPI00352963B4